MDTTNDIFRQCFGVSRETIAQIDAQTDRIREIRGQFGTAEPEDDSPICAACGGAVTNGVCDDCVASAIKMLTGKESA